MIIQSLLDSDFYKFTMAQAVLHQYPATMVKYRFRCREGSVFPRSGEAEKKAYLTALCREIDHLCSLRFTEEELAYLSRISFFKPDFIEYLRLFQLNRKYIRIQRDKTGELDIVIEGPWVSTIWFEVPCLAIISELYHRGEEEHRFLEGRRRLFEKIRYYRENIPRQSLPLFRFADFGTRRRYSHNWHRQVIEILAKECNENFIGTSNVLFAKEIGVKPIGTMAHEYLQAHQQLGVRLIDSQKAALDSWVREYRGELGIALSDVVTFDAFLRDFDLFFAKLFDGCRHDSGDPYEWCEKLIRHYEKLKIDSRTKTAIFSDGLDFEKAVGIFNTFHKRIGMSFGIGTNLTNDLGPPALNIVIKMVACNGRPVAKISDSKGKWMGDDPEFLHRLEIDFGIHG
jgi:nicotinate phosphoribosyltransferase